MGRGGDQPVWGGVGEGQEDTSCKTTLCILLSAYVSSQSRSLFGEHLTMIMVPFAREVLGREKGLVTFLQQECVHTMNKGDANRGLCRHQKWQLS